MAFDIENIATSLVAHVCVCVCEPLPEHRQTCCAVPVETTYFRPKFFSEVIFSTTDDHQIQWYAIAGSPLLPAVKYGGRQ